MARGCHGLQRRSWRDYDRHGGPTVIAPLLRSARLSKRPPAQLLQWEAIVNDPIGALAAVLAYEVVVVSMAGVPAGEAAGGTLILGICVAA